MPTKRKTGRPQLPDDAKGRVYTFYAPKDLADNMEMVLRYTGGTISSFLRDAVEEAARRTMQEYKDNKLKEYAGGSIEPPK